MNDQQALQLERELAERKRVEALLNGQKRVLELVAIGAPLPVSLAALVCLIEEYVPGMVGSILLLDEDGVRLRHGAAPNLPPEYTAAIDGVAIGPEVGSCGTAAFCREAVFVEDIATDPLWKNFKSLALRHGFRACWSTPIFDATKRVLGTFAMYYRRPMLPEPEHRWLIDIATHTAAIAIGRHRNESALRASEELLRRLYREQRAIYSCSRTMMRAADEQELLNDICGIVCTEAGYRMARVTYVGTDDEKVVRPVASAGGDNGDLAAADIFRDETAAAVRSGESVCIQDFLADDRAASWRERVMACGCRSCITIPLKDERGSVFGVLTIFSPEPDAFIPDEIRLLEGLATDLEFGITGLRARVELQTERERQRRAEETLRESERRYRQLVDSVTDYFYTVQVRDNRPVATVHGPGCAAVTGYTSEEYASDPDLWYRMIHEPDRPAVMEEAARILAGETVSPLEHRITHRNGSLRWVRNTPVPHYDRERRLTAYDGLIEDITEQKRIGHVMEARLRLLEYADSHSMDELISATLDEIEALTGSCIGFYHFLEADQKTLLLQNWSTNTLKNICTAQGKGSHYDVDQAGVWVDCVHERRPVIHNDYASLPHRKGMPEGHAPVVREAVVPIFRGDLITAIIGVGNKATDYDENDIETVSRLGDLSWDITERKRAEERLRRLNDELEQRVAERTAELERKNAELARMNRIFVGRELRMAELKKRIKEQENMLGRGTE